MPATDTDNLIQHALSLSTGVALNVMERPGAGTPVICLHGIWDNWQYFLPLAPPGPGSFEGRPLLMVDHRGHGGSSKPATGYDWSDYAGDVVALVNERGYAQVTLVGHSLGALTSLLAAAEMPEKIESMVLEDPPLPLRPTSGDVFRSLLELKQQSFEAVVEEFMIWRPWLAREQAEGSAQRLLDTADGVLKTASEGRLANGDVPKAGVTIDAPTLVIQAGIVEQRAFGEGGRELLEAVIPNLMIETIPDTSHNVLREQPEPYRQLLAEFFGG